MFLFGDDVRLEVVSIKSRRSLAVGAVIAVVVPLMVAGIYMTVVKRPYPGYYEYPPRESAVGPAWKELCRIPEDILERMTDEQLAQAVADFPFLFEITCSARIGDVEILADISDAYEELLSRGNAKDTLIDKIRQLEQAEGDTTTIELLKYLVLNEDAFADSLTEDERDELTNGGQGLN